MKILIKIHVIAAGQVIESLQPEVGGDWECPGVHGVQVEVLVEFFLFRFSEKRNNLVLLAIDLLALGVNSFGPVVHVLLVGVLAVEAPAAQGARLDPLGMWQVLHLETELVEGRVTRRAVEQVLRGEGLADVAGFVFGLNDLHHLVGLPVTALHQAAVDETLEAGRLVAAGAAVIDTLAVAVIKAGVDVAIVNVDRRQKLVASLGLLQSKCRYNVGSVLCFPLLVVSRFLGRGNETRPQLTPLLQFARPAKFSLVQTKFALSAVVHHTG